MPVGGRTTSGSSLTRKRAFPAANSVEDALGVGGRSLSFGAVGSPLPVSPVTGRPMGDLCELSAAPGDDTGKSLCGAYRDCKANFFMCHATQFTDVDYAFFI